MPKKPKCDDLNMEQLIALRDYADWAGKDWKDKLLSDWMRAGSDWPEASERYHLLQQIRNQHGPSWLEAIKLS